MKSPEGAHADPIESHTHVVDIPIGTGMNILEQEIYAYFYWVLHQLCVRLYIIRMNLSGPLNDFKSFNKISRGAHADPIESHTHAVWSSIGTGMDFCSKKYMRCFIGCHTSCVSGSI